MDIFANFALLLKKTFMLDKLQALKDRFIEVGQLIIQPDAMSDMSKYTKLTK